MSKCIVSIKVLCGLAIIGLLCLEAIPGQATSVIIPNFSFENPSTKTKEVASLWVNVNQSASADNAYNPYQYRGDAYYIGVNPTTDPASGGVGYPGILGENLAYVFASGPGTGLSQMLDATLAPNTRYTLTVTVGTRNGSAAGPFSGSQIELLAGSTVIASATDNVGPVAGTFMDQVAVLADSDAFPTLVGQPLTIRLLTTQLLSSGSLQATDWDNIRLDTTLLSEETTTIEFDSGEKIDLRLKAEPDQKIWILFELPSLYPGIQFVRPGDSYCQENGRYAYPFMINGEFIPESVNMYYSQSYAGSEIDFGEQDFSGIGDDLLITIKKGNDPSHLETIQTIQLIETKYVQGKVEVPKGYPISVTKLDVAWLPTDEIYVNADGSFQTKVTANTPVIVTAIFRHPDSTENIPHYIASLMAVVLPDDTSSLSLSGKSTALALVWSALGLQSLFESYELCAIRTRLSELTEVQILGELLEKKLAENPYVLSEIPLDADLEFAAKDALEAASNIISLEFDATQDTLRSTRGKFAPSADVRPEKITGISVYERDHSGNISIKNDTPLYLSVQITDINNNILCNHVASYLDQKMVSPQSFGSLSLAGNKAMNIPNGQNCTVEIIAPGSPSYSNGTAPYEIWKYVFLRTSVEKYLWSSVSLILGSSLIKDITFLEILVAQAPDLVDLVASQANQGDMAGAMQTFGKMLLDDFISRGPIIQALARTIAGKFLYESTKQRILEIMEKLACRAIPAAQVGFLYDLLNYSVLYLKTMGAMATVDQVNIFQVTFPPQIDEVAPNKVKTDGNDKEFTITGKGFGKISWDGTLLPNILFTDENGEGYSTQPSYVSSDGTEMRVIISGSWLEEKTGFLSVQIHHPHSLADFVAVKQNVVELGSQNELIPCFTITPVYGTPPLAVNLDATCCLSDGPIAAYSWLSSDGQASTGQITSMVFTKEGIYTIILTVTANSDETASIQQAVVVKKDSEAWECRYGTRSDNQAWEDCCSCRSPDGACMDSRNRVYWVNDIKGSIERVDEKNQFYALDENGRRVMSLEVDKTWEDRGVNHTVNDASHIREIRIVLEKPEELYSYYNWVFWLDIYRNNTFGMACNGEAETRLSYYSQGKWHNRQYPYLDKWEDIWKVDDDCYSWNTDNKYMDCPPCLIPSYVGDLAPPLPDKSLWENWPTP